MLIHTPLLVFLVLEPIQWISGLYWFFFVALQSVTLPASATRGCINVIVHLNCI